MTAPPVTPDPAVVAELAAEAAGRFGFAGKCDLVGDFADPVIAGALAAQVAGDDRFAARRLARALVDPAAPVPPSLASAQAVVDRWRNDVAAAVLAMATDPRVVEPPPETPPLVVTAITELLAKVKNLRLETGEETVVVDGATVRMPITFDRR